MLHFTVPPTPHYIVSGEDTYPPGESHVARSNIGVFDLLVVTRGTLFLEEAGSPLYIHSGEYGILRPDLAHQTAVPCREETHFYWLHFQTLGYWAEVNEQTAFLTPREDHPYPAIEPFSFYLSRHKTLSDLGSIDKLMRKLLLLQRDPLAASRWKQQQLFHELLYVFQIDGGDSGKNPALQTAEACAAYLRQHYKESVSYRSLSKALHFHANYIALCMKRVYGCTPLEFLTRHRLEQAKSMLIHTNEAIGRIAEESGFGNAPYFVRCFKRHIGETPSAFRNRYRKMR